MRLACEVRVGLREGGGGGGRALRSTLALVGTGPKTGMKDYCIIHFSSTNKLGRKYQLNGNVHQIFVKFCAQGKTTIQFKNPPHDLFIQGDPVQLKLFLKTLKRCLEGTVGADDLSHISNAGVMPDSVNRTKLIILQTADLPTKGLPRTLTHLQISGLPMCNFKREILSLRNLRILNLSDNCIEKIPRELGNLPHVVELMLSNNKLGNTENPDWRWLEGSQIMKNLKLLDLSSNNLNINIPQTLFKLRNLVTLKLDNNNLKFLPNGIGTIKSLRFLSAAKNNLTVLPGNLLLLHLEQLDLSANPLPSDLIRDFNIRFKQKTLVELSSIIVIKYCLPYAANTIPYTLVDYLDNSKYCICGTPTFDSVNYIKCVYSLKSFCQTIVSDGKNDACFDCYLCSYKCFRKYASRKRSREN